MCAFYMLLLDPIVNVLEHVENIPDAPDKQVGFSELEFINFTALTL